MTKAQIQTQYGHYWHGNWIVAPIDDIIIPRNARLCLGQRWWLTTGNGEVLFFKTYTSPQCNPSEQVMQHMLDQSSVTHSAVAGKPVVTSCKYIEMAYIPHDCSDYCA